MTDIDVRPTANADDLEEVEVRPRARRDVVVSVRLAPSEATALSTLATRAGMSVSELTRSIVRNAIKTQWRVQVSGRRGVVAYAHETGGDFSRVFHSPAPPRGRVQWCSEGQPLTTVE